MSSSTPPLVNVPAVIPKSKSAVPVPSSTVMENTEEETILRASFSLDAVILASA